MQGLRGEGDTYSPKEILVTMMGGGTLAVLLSDEEREGREGGREGGVVSERRGGRNKYQ